MLPATAHSFPLPPQESLCSPQLMLEDGEGLSRLAHTVQVLLEQSHSSQCAGKQEAAGMSSSTQC